MGRNSDQFKETKEYLSQIRRMTAIIENREMDKAKWEALACSISAKIKEDVVQTTPKLDKIGDYATEIVMLDKEIEVCRRIKHRIIRQIETMPDVNHVMALSMVYIRDMNTDDLAEERDRCRRTAHRNLLAAYREFEKLYGDCYKNMIKCP
jgi:hypothetical protein